MKNLSELEAMYREQGDALYSLALELGGSRDRAEQLLMLADDDFLDSGALMRGKQKRYIFMKSRLEKHSGRRSPTFRRVQLPEDVYSKLISGAKIFIKSGGRARSRLTTCIVVGIMLIILALLALYAWHFVMSDEHRRLTGEFYERNASAESCKVFLTIEDNIPQRS